MTWRLGTREIVVEGYPLVQVQPLDELLQTLLRELGRKGTISTRWRWQSESREFAGEPAAVPQLVPLLELVLPEQARATSRLRRPGHRCSRSSGGSTGARATGVAVYPDGRRILVEDGIAHEADALDAIRAGSCCANDCGRSNARGAPARPRPRRRRARARRAARRGGRRGRRPPRRARSSLSASAAVTTSTASSPTLRAHGGDALVEELRRVRALGPLCARSAIVRQSAGAKHESEPVWQAGPFGRTRSERARRRRSRRGAPRPPSCCPTSRPCASTPRASGSRTTPRPTRACGARPRRPSRRASARGRSRRPGRSPRGARPQAASRSCHPQSAQLVAQRREPLGILVQDRREQRRLRHLERLGDVPRVAGAARRDHRHRHRVRDGPRDLEVVALAACRRSRST